MAYETISGSECMYTYTALWGWFKGVRFISFMYCTFFLLPPYGIFSAMAVISDDPIAVFIKPYSIMERTVW